MNYRITNDELIDFARKIYDEACHGYLDLKNSICDKMVREFLDGRTIAADNIQATPPSYSQQQVFDGGTWSGGYTVSIDPSYPPSQNNYQITTVSNGAGDITLPSNIHIQTASGNRIELRDYSDAVRSDDPQISENVIVRDDPRFNFEGNESERF